MAASMFNKSPALQGCIAPLIVNTGEGSKEVEGRAVLAESSPTLYSQQRERTDLELQFVVQSTVKEIHVLVVHSSPAFG